MAEKRDERASTATGRIACDLDCGNAHPESDMWRITRHPTETTWLGTLTGLIREIQTSGTRHLWICPDCWHAAEGFFTTLRDVRRTR